MPEQDLDAPRHRQGGQPGRPAGRGEPVGQDQAQRQVRHQVIERLVRGVHRLEPAEREPHRCHRRAGGTDPQARA